MNNLKSVTLIGATGLIGSHLLTLLQDDPSISEIRILVRRSLQLDHPKVKIVIVDFNDKDAIKSNITKCDTVFCMVGTTNKKVKGNKEAYRKVDYDIPVDAATYSRDIGCEQFAIVSAVGADSKSSNFYLQLKGEVEDFVSQLHFPSLLIFRPSLLIGERKESRFGESLGKIVMPLISFLLPPRMRAIKGSDVALAMAKASKSDLKEKHIFEYPEMNDFLSQK